MPPGADRCDLALTRDISDAALRLAEVLPVSEAAGTAPVLLLDDALSELDPDVRGNVLQEIQTAEQVFLTSPEPLTVRGAAGWVVDAGGIAAA